MHPPFNDDDKTRGDKQETFEKLRELFLRCHESIKLSYTSNAVKSVTVNIV